MSRKETFFIVPATDTGKQWMGRRVSNSWDSRRLGRRDKTSQSGYKLRRQTAKRAIFRAILKEKRENICLFAGRESEGIVSVDGGDLPV